MKIEKQDLVEKIAATEYFRSAANPLLTVCILTLDNGFSAVGKSCCLAPETFDEQVGCDYAFEDAVDQLWELHGYHLRELMAYARTEDGQSALEAIEDAAAADKPVILLPNGGLQVR